MSRGWARLICVPRLICSVRDCGRPLSEEGNALRCDRGHSFDRARAGYWNLLQPQDRKAPEAGDRAEAVEARKRWLERGHVTGLSDVIAEVGEAAALADGTTVLDVGCGNGWFADRLAAGRCLDVCGIDLSNLAIRNAARRLPGATWIVANADRGLPLADRSVDLVLSVFGRRPAAELARVLRPGGNVVVVVPGEDDLAELRDAAQGQTIATDRVPRVVEEFAGTPLRLSHREAWQCREAHDRAGIDDLLAMTYRGARYSQRERLMQELEESTVLKVTLAADVLLFQ
jgi:23S rRNA (guanine745-N1)-methyltransferase